MNTKYPDIEVPLTTMDGNAFVIMGSVTKAMRDHGISAKELSSFRSECMRGDYDHLLRTCMAWVSVT